MQTLEPLWPESLLDLETFLILHSILPDMTQHQSNAPNVTTVLGLNSLPGALHHLRFLMPSWWLMGALKVDIPAMKALGLPTPPSLGSSKYG